MRYAPRKLDPKSSITYEDDKQKRIEFAVADASVEEEFTLRHKLVLIDFAVGMGVIVWGLVTQGWYMNEISMVFLAMGLLAGILGGLDKTIAEEFVRGIADFAYAACIIGIARGILVVAEGGMIIDSILNWLAGLLAGAPSFIYTTFMYIVLGLLSPAGSVQLGSRRAHHARHGSADRAHGPQPRGRRHRAAVRKPDHQHYQSRRRNDRSGPRGRKDFLWPVVEDHWKFFIFMVLFGLVATMISGLLPV